MISYSVCIVAILAALGLYVLIILATLDIGQRARDVPADSSIPSATASTATITSPGMVSFRAEYEKDEVFRTQELANWSKKFYYDTNTLICASPTMWHEQESWEIAMQIWLKDCDVIMFFVDMSNNSLHHFHRHDRAKNTYWSLNKKHFSSSYEWLFNPHTLAKPTIFVNPDLQDPFDMHRQYPDLTLDYQLDISPFSFKNHTHFWVVPLNFFIISEIHTPGSAAAAENSTCSIWSDITNVDETGGRKLEMWDKEASMYLFIYRHFRKSGDWVMKFDSDSIVFVPILKAFLLFYDAKVPHYLGANMWLRINKGLKTVPQGGAFYVVSMRALERVVPELLNMPYYKGYFQKFMKPNTHFNEGRFNHLKKAGKFRTLCMRSNRVSEDVMMSLCLRNVGVLADKTKDWRGKMRFVFYPYTTWRKYRKKYSKIPLGFHDYKVEVLGRASLSKTWKMLYDKFVTKKRYTIETWFDRKETNKVEMIQAFQMSRPRVFEYPPKARKNNKLINVTQFVIDAQNCMFCVESYPKCSLDWMTNPS